MIYQWLKTKKKEKTFSRTNLDMQLFDCFVWLLVAVQKKQKRSKERDRLIKLGQYGNWVSNKIFMLVFSPFQRDGFLWTQVENGQAPPKNFLSFSPYQTTLTSVLSHLFSIHPILPLIKHTLELTWAKRVGSSQNIPLPWEPSTHLTNNYL